MPSNNPDACPTCGHKLTTKAERDRVRKATPKLVEALKEMSDKDLREIIERLTPALDANAEAILSAVEAHQAEKNIPEDLKELAASCKERIRSFGGSPMTDSDQIILSLIGRIAELESRLPRVEWHGPLATDEEFKEVLRRNADHVIAGTNRVETALRKMGAEVPEIKAIGLSQRSDALIVWTVIDGFDRETRDRIYQGERRVMARNPERRFEFNVIDIKTFAEIENCQAIFARPSLERKLAIDKMARTAEEMGIYDRFIPPNDDTDPSSES